jgi:hypothetical protein
LPCFAWSLVHRHGDYLKRPVQMLALVQEKLVAPGSLSHGSK